METLLLFLIKLIIIYISSGIITLIAYYIAQEIIKFANFTCLNSPDNINLKVKKTKQLSRDSGFYEVLFLGEESLKLFSSNKGMKVLG